MVFQNDILAGSSASGTSTAVHTIDQSIRFNDDDTAYMTRTPSSAGTEETWTYSLWVKRGDIDTNSTLLEVHQDTNNRFIMYLRSSAQLYNLDIVWRTSGTSRVLRTTQSLRDPSAWYSFVLTADTNNSIASERLRLYINGSRVTDFSQNDVASYISSGQSLFVNKAILHTIGRYSAGSGNEMDGYLAEIVFIDGQALDPSSFGEYNSSNIWVPKDVSGLTFGTNGFHIKGESASDLGNDSSGNNNDFTTSGLATHDQVLDSPTNNFSTLNPLIPGLGLTTVTYSEGNLKVTFSNNDATESTIGIPSSGKWYFEGYVIDTTYFRDDVQTAIGLRPEGFSHQRDDVNETGFAYGQNGKKIEGDGSSGSASSYGASYSADDIIGVAVDMDASPATLTFYKNNASQGTAFTFTDKTIFRFGSVAQRNSSGWILNFGQDSTFAGENVNANDYSNYDGTSDGNGVGSFFYTPPTGHLALCTKNLGS